MAAATLCEQALVEDRVGELLFREEHGRWTYYHDEGRAMHELFMLLLHEQIFDGSIPDVFFAPLHANPNPNL